MAEGYLIDPTLAVDGVSLHSINPYNVGVVEDLVKRNFPVDYPQYFYKRLIANPGYNLISNIAYVGDVPVGCIIAFCEEHNDSVHPGKQEASILIRQIPERPPIGLSTCGNPYADVKGVPKKGPKKNKDTDVKLPDAHCYIAVLIVTEPFRSRGISKMMVHSLVSQLAVANSDKIVDLDKAGKVHLRPRIHAVSALDFVPSIHGSRWHQNCRL
eukprot:GHVH01006394.1.p1 GENE.GHVH01006394.1~~GHVH01006394.1.p1  ORF type:complete len:213 (+),score=16.12 GHVH01006394.1:44-682(+)